MPLVEQQVNYIQKWTTFRVNGYHGSDRVITNAGDTSKEHVAVKPETKAEWDAELEDTRILVMVHDTLKDVLQHDLIGNLYLSSPTLDSWL